MAARTVVIHVDAGAPVRLAEDCPSCGWADLWRHTLNHLTPTGVSTLADATMCARCGHRVVTKNRG